jgi:predicted nucleic acid-binding protein
LTRYLLDTNVLIHYSKRRSPSTELILELVTRGEELCVSSINVAEVYSGAYVGEYPEFDVFLSTLECIPVILADGLRAGQWRHDYRRRGVQLTTQDVLVAAVAQRVGATLVTENIKDFPMRDIVVVDPRSR